MKKIPFAPLLPSRRRLFSRRRFAIRPTAMYALTLVAAGTAAWVLLKQQAVA